MDPELRCLDVSTVHAVFDEADTNKDGVLDAEEVERLLVTLYTRMGKPFVAKYPDKLRAEVPCAILGPDGLIRLCLAGGGGI